MSASIPVSAFAVAGDAAARLLGEPLADLFDSSGLSRARFVAIAAMIKIFPGAAQIEIARCFGVTAPGRDFARALAAARGSAWWRRADVERAIDEIRASLARIRVTDLMTGDELIVRLGEFQRASGDDEPRDVVHRRRVWRAARLLSALAPRAANPTASLMGDPTPERSALHARLARESAIVSPSERGR